MTLHSPNAALDAIRHAYAERTEAARRAKAEGKPVVAYLGNSVPVELILAAGCFPLLITGHPDEPAPLADRYLDDDFDGDLGAVFQRIVSGYFNFADLIVIPRTSNTLLYLYYFLIETRRLQPEQAFPEVYLFDILHSPYWSTGQYVYGRVLDMKSNLERIAGRPIETEAMCAAIAVTNANRVALQEMNGLRRLPQPVCSGSDMLRAIGAAQFMDRATNTKLVRELLGQAEGMAPQDGVRLMVKGAPQHDTRLYELVESLGATVVADDHLTGERVLEHLIDETIDPIAALTQKYHLNSPSIRSFPQAAQDQRFIDIVVAADVQGVIFYHDEFDDTLGWDYPAQKKLLDDRGIPSLLLQQQSYRAPDLAAQQAAVRELIARSRK